MRLQVGHVHRFERRRTAISSEIANFSTATSGPLGALQRALERLGLRDGPREPVEDEALLGVGLVEAVHHHLDDDVVGHVLAAVHERLAP